MGSSKFNDVFFTNHLAINTGTPQRGVHINKDADQLRLSSTGHLNYCDILSDENSIQFTYGNSGDVAINIDHSTGLVTFPVGGSFGGLYFEVFITDGIDNNFTLAMTPAGGTYENILCILNGSVQPPDGVEYTINGRILTLGGTTRPAGELLITGYSVANTGLKVDIFTASITGDEIFTLSETPLGGTLSNVLVFINGSPQLPQAAYQGLTDTSLTVKGVTTGEKIIAIYAYNT